MDGEYVFPRHRIRTGRLKDARRTPLILVSCGSFSPVTFLHLRMFEMARDHARAHTDFEVIAGYMSPVTDAYQKSGLVSARHRFVMCDMACDRTSDWLMVDPWEARQDRYIPTANVLDHVHREINGDDEQGMEFLLDGRRKRRPVRIILLAGSDLFQTMFKPDIWTEKDLHHILGKYGSYVIERIDADHPNGLGASPHHQRVLSFDQSKEKILQSTSLEKYTTNIFMVPQPVRNDVSSTRVRSYLSHGESVRYLIPECVIEYIEAERLYLEPDGKKSIYADADAGASASASASAKAIRSSAKTSGEANGVEGHRATNHGQTTSV